MNDDPRLDPLDGVQLLRTYLLHCRYVRYGLHQVTRELEARAERHDDSKLTEDEFAGFSRINNNARRHPYGSAEYRAGLKQEAPVIKIHYDRNRHHPESGLVGEAIRVVDWRTSERAALDYPAGWMTFFDLIEMVADWHAAYRAYGSQGTWAENLARQHARYDGWFTREQWWLIDQVAHFLTVAVHA